MTTKLPQPKYDRHGILITKNSFVYLKNGDIIKKGDEFEVINSKNNKWDKVSPIEFGMKVPPSVYHRSHFIYRRKLI